VIATRRRDALAKSKARVRRPAQVGRWRCARLRSQACCASGLHFNAHMDETDGPLVFAHACKRGLEGIVSSKGIRAIVLGARRIG
jgi:hypothetical protein